MLPFMPLDSQVSFVLCSLPSIGSSYQYQFSCVSQFQQGYKLGHRIFELTAMETGSYGLDISSSLPQLIERLLKVENDVKFVIDELDPVYLMKYKEQLYDLCKRGKIIDMKCPVQSGNERILRLMNRFSDICELLSSFKKICKVCPSFTTHIIVGFPSESDQEFQDTLSFIKRVGFNFIYVHPYWDGGFTPPSKITPQCSQKIINDRVNATIKFLKENRISYTAYFDRGNING